MQDSRLENSSMRDEKIRDIAPELLDKYYKQQCTPEEIELVHHWFIGMEHQHNNNERVIEEWENTPAEGDQKELLQDILYKIHYNIHIDELTEKKSKSRNAWTIVASVAASIIIFGIGFWLGNSPLTIHENYAELHVPYGSRIQFELPDGSTGWLNSGSTLKYPVQFRGENRKVFLDGEGYFDVIHNAEKPFIVQNGNLQVVALGTSFNVQAFKDDDKEVSLVKGKVVLKKIEADDTKRQISEMSPGQHLIINRQTNIVKLIDGDIEKSIAWKDGKLIFRNDPLSHVIKQMEHLYNVKFEVKNPELFKYHFHATFEDETLYEAVRLLSLTSDIDYEILKRRKKPDGTYIERKVVLYEKETN